MIVLDYSLDDSKNGGKITAFSYSHSLNELCGSWSATVAGGSFTAGENISFSNVMTNGIISRAKKDSSGLWHVEGYDAGIKLMRSTPAIEDLPEGNARGVLQSLADFCDIPLYMTRNGLSGFNVRSLISASTCAEAVLEIALLSGLMTANFMFRHRPLEQLLLSRISLMILARISTWTVTLLKLPSFSGKAVSIIMMIRNLVQPSITLAKLRPLVRNALLIRARSLTARSL